MKEIVVISGKGGTGKTSLTASFAVLAGGEVVVADCDVDAADMHLLLEPDHAADEEFFGGTVAVIDPERCTGCGECVAVCRFDAIEQLAGRCEVDEIGCEGCGYCARICPENAIADVPQNVGRWYSSRIRTGATMIHARLKIGADNSGKLVAKVKNEARVAAENGGRQRVLVDGSPGVGCPVISSLTGASLVVLVTEPTVSGLHDLRRVVELVKRFGIPAGCVINKADLNESVREDLRRFLAGEAIENLAEIPYDESFTAAITAGRTVVEQEGEAARLIRDTWRRILALTEEKSAPAEPSPERRAT